MSERKFYKSTAWIKYRNAYRLCAHSTEAVRSAETMAASADKVITKTYETAKKKVMADKVAIQKHVENLSGDAVASELITLLDEYCRERDGGG